MVDFRSSGWSGLSSSSYSSGGSSTSRTSERSAAFAKPATGQWQPGALTNAPANTSTSVAQPTYMAGGNYPFVTINGQSGQLVPAQSLIGNFDYSPAFAAKMETLTPQDLAAQYPQPQAPTLSFMPQNVSNPFQPNYVGQAMQNPLMQLPQSPQISGTVPQGLPAAEQAPTERTGWKGAIDKYFAFSDWLTGAKPGEMKLESALPSGAVMGNVAKTAATKLLGNPGTILNAATKAGIPPEIASKMVRRSAAGAISRWGGIVKTQAAADAGDEGAKKIMEAVAKYGIAAENAAKSVPVQYAAKAIPASMQNTGSVVGQVTEASTAASAKTQSIWNRLLYKNVVESKLIQNVNIETGAASTIQQTTSKTVPRLGIDSLGKLAKLVLIGGTVSVVSAVGFSLFQKAEAGDSARQAVSEAKWTAKELGIHAEDYVQYQNARAVENAVYDTQITVLNALGFKGTRLNIDTKRQAAEIMDACMADRAIGVELGETEEMLAARKQADRIAMDIEYTDYKNNERLRIDQIIKDREAEENAAFNSNRISTEATILGMKSAQSAEFNSQRIATEKSIAAIQRHAAEESAAFWIEYKKKIMALEAEERQRIADFWLKYEEMQAELAASRWDAGGSQLGFGLLR